MKWLYMEYIKGNLVKARAVLATVSNDEINGYHCTYVWEGV